jgi:hypothetical protein
MKALNDKALKEWAVLSRALHEGRQVFLLRKGGIADKDGKFTVDEEEFFIFPSYEHQNREDLQEKFRPWIDDSARMKAPEGKLDIDVYARVDSVAKVESLERLIRALPLSVWSESFLRKRWEYKPENPLYAVFLRCFRYPHPHRIDVDPDYAGCVSWVTLKQPLSPTKFYPVLSPEVFEDKKRKVLDAIKADALR